MPTYQFECKKCKKTFEMVETFKEHERHEEKCPKCGSTEIEQVYDTVNVKTSKKS